MFLTSLRAAIARVFWWLSPWRLVREAAPVEGPRILIGAPHTSNFDFALMLGIAWDARMRIHWLGKRELFKGIAGPIMRGLGGIAVDRKNAAGVVDAVVAKARATDRFLLVVTPEGTRQGNGWRSGERVRHPKFGEGVILAVEGTGTHAQASVKFGPEVGVKQLLLSVAPLERL